MIKTVAILLDKYYFTTRYPSYLPGGTSIDIFSEQESLTAIDLAKEVIAFVKGRLSDNK